MCKFSVASKGLIVTKGWGCPKGNIVITKIGSFNIVLNRLGILHYIELGLIIIKTYTIIQYKKYGNHYTVISTVIVFFNQQENWLNTD